jgi:hypothetical protein
MMDDWDIDGTPHQCIALEGGAHVQHVLHKEEVGAVVRQVIDDNQEKEESRGQDESEFGQAENGHGETVDGVIR